MHILKDSLCATTKTQFIIIIRKIPNEKKKNIVNGF